MTHFAIALVLVSCAGHAAWNLLSKRSSKTLAFFCVANLGALLLAFPFFVLCGGHEAFGAPARLWLHLLLTGLCLAAYFTFLALAYRSGDVSVVYPLARTAPVFVVLLEGVSQSRWPTLLPGLGIALIVAGCFILPWKRVEIGPQGLAWKNYVNRGSLWALATALASSGYTVIDDLGMDVMSEVAPELRGAFIYGYLELVSATAFLLLAVLALDGVRGIGRVCRTEWRPALTVGVLIFATYMLVLWAYTHAEKVAYVAALRQFSVVLGVLGAILFLKEGGGRIRLLASVVMVAGLLLIGLAGGAGSAPA